MAYQDRDAFASRTTMPVEFIDEIEMRSPGWVDTQLGLIEAKLNARLRKRYDAPFTTPVPDVVLDWQTAMMTHRCYLRRGVDPTDAQMVDVKAAADDAWKEVLEAADAQNGLFDLPLRQDTTATGVTKGAPLVYSEASPYVSFDVQADIGRVEDSNRGGTFA